MTFSTTDFVFVNHREGCQLCVLTSAILHIESDQSLRKFSHQRRLLNLYPLIMLMRFLPCKSSNDMFDFLKCELCKEFDTPDKIDEPANKMLVLIPRLIRGCASAQSRQSLQFSHIQRVVLDLGLCHTS